MKSAVIAGVAYPYTANSAAEKLSLRPPELIAPRVVNVGVSGGNFRLGDGDHVIRLPKEPVTGSVQIDGLGKTRHIVLIGGHIESRPRYDPFTMMMLDESDYAVYTQLGFTGATGGTFRIRCSEKTGVFGLQPKQTSDLSFTSTSEQIRDAINYSLGSNACLAVIGSGIGGPWKVVPTATAALGRVDLVLENLTGSVLPTERRNIYSAAKNALVLKNWLGTCHIEGLRLGGPYQNDAINIDNKYASAAFQGANLHCRGFHHVFHDDWMHPDGMQCYRGPSQLYLEKCDFFSKGGNGFIAQPGDIAGLEDLHDWGYDRVQFRSYRSDDDPSRSSDGSTSLFVAKMPSRWRHHMDGCHSTRWSWVKQREIPGEPTKRLNYGGDIVPPTGLIFDAPNNAGSSFFCDPDKDQCGFNYISPGYTNSYSRPELPLRLAHGNAAAETK